MQCEVKIFSLVITKLADLQSLTMSLTRQFYCSQQSSKKQEIVHMFIRVNEYNSFTNIITKYISSQLLVL